MKTLNLCLHAGANRVERAAIEATLTPPATRTWSPIPHEALIDRVRGSLVRSGLAVTAEAHALSHEGQRYFGLLAVENGHNAADYGLVVGLRNSHDQKFPAGLVVGSQVFVCDNLAFSGEISISRKHTTNIMRDLPGLIECAVGQIADARHHQDNRILAYKGRNLTDPQVHDLLIQSVDCRVLPNARVPDVLAEWRKPRHEEFKPRTAWSLFNSYTEVLKGSGGLFDRPRATQALHGLLDVACSVS
jgi:hypothetical protein